MSSVGKISLDLNVNSKDFNKQVDGIQKQTTKAFGMMSVAIGNIVSNMLQSALSGVGNFVKDSINKGSEISELQNVVDSVFTSMSDKVEEFSKSALSSYGLTEAQSKKMVGTFGAMSKSFGYTEAQAFDMSTALTGLTADVASFYNLNHDEAYTKMKSVFTGETESLKELGVVMTQAALDQFALEQGFGKTTKQMTEQEKVALRLAFVQNKLSVASGDFLKTQDQWANQTRILTGQFDSLKAALGQGFINVLTPVIKAVNTLMAKLVQLANLFKDFTARLMGVSSKGGAGAAMAEVAEAADQAATSTGGISDAANGAAKAAKAAQKSLMGFDEINKLSKSDSGSSSGAGSGGSSAGMDFGGFESTGVEDVGEKAKVSIPVLDSLKEKLSELSNLFKNGFKEGLGDDFGSSFNRIKDHINSLRGNLKAINNEVKGSANKWVNTITTALGRTLGSLGSIAQTLVEFFIGSVSMYVDQSKDFIRDRIIGIFDASGSIGEIWGKFSSAFASIFEIFRGDKAKQIGADIISIFSNAFLGITELSLRFGSDILNLIAQPFIDNKDAIKEAIGGALEPISTILSTLSSSVRSMFEHAFNVYEEYIQPAFQRITEGLSSLVATLLDAYNTHIAPVLSRLGEKFSSVWDEHIHPALTSIITVVGKVIEVISHLWNKVVSPFIGWIVKTLVPILAPIFESIGSIVMGLFGTIGDIIRGIMTALGGLLDFIAGVFTGDWMRAWEGIKNFVIGIWDTIKGVIKLVWDAISGIIKTGFNVIKGVISAIWSTIKSVLNAILGGVEKMVNGVINGLNKMIGAINNLKINIPDWVPVLGGKSLGFNIPQISTVSLPRLAEGGYVKANQPQPVIVGDNKTQGEIITPENKMLEVMLKALESFFGKLKDLGTQTRSETGDIIIPIYLDGSLLDEVIVSAQERQALRSGGM